MTESANTEPVGADEDEGPSVYKYEGPKPNEEFAAVLHAELQRWIEHEAGGIHVVVDEGGGCGGILFHANADGLQLLIKSLQRLVNKSLGITKH